MIVPSSSVAVTRKFGRQRDSRSIDQRMVAARRRSGDGKPANRPLPSWCTGDVRPWTGSVPDDPRRQTPGDRLVAEAHAQDRHLAVQVAHNLERAAGLARRTRPGRKHDRLRLHAANVGDVDRIVAHDASSPAQPLEIAGQVEDEAVVVVDEQDHVQLSW